MSSLSGMRVLATDRWLVARRFSCVVASEGKEHIVERGLADAKPFGLDADGVEPPDGLDERMRPIRSDREAEPSTCWVEKWLDFRQCADGVGRLVEADGVDNR